MLIGAVVVASGIALLEWTGALHIAEIDVVGLDRLTPEEVRVASGIDLGDRLWAVSARGAADEVEGLALVAESRVRRTGPRAIRIEVSERVPVLQVTGAAESVLVDRAGVIIAREHGSQLPTIELPRRPPVPGGHVDDDPVLANAHAVWRGLSGPLRVEVVTYRGARPEELELQLRRGVSVKFGLAERIDEKVRAMGAVLADVDDAEVEALDVRAPGNPVIVSAP